MLSPAWYAGPMLFAAAAVAVGIWPSGSTRADPFAVRWLGHAAFEIVSPSGTRVLIDPWVVANPSAPAAYKDTTRWAGAEARPAAILVTHPHGDHDGEVAMLARLTGRQERKF